MNHVNDDEAYVMFLSYIKFVGKKYIRPLERPWPKQTSMAGRKILVSTTPGDAQTLKHLQQPSAFLTLFGPFAVNRGLAEAHVHRIYGVSGPPYHCKQRVNGS
jgi:hypothetical protein